MPERRTTQARGSACLSFLGDWPLWDGAYGEDNLGAAPRLCVIFLHWRRRLPPPDQQNRRMRLSRVHRPPYARVYRDDAAPILLPQLSLPHTVL